MIWDIGPHVHSGGIYPYHRSRYRFLPYSAYWCFPDLLTPCKTILSLANASEPYSLSAFTLSGGFLPIISWNVFQTCRDWLLVASRFFSYFRLARGVLRAFGIDFPVLRRFGCNIDFLRPWRPDLGGFRGLEDVVFPKSVLHGD